MSRFQTTTILVVLTALGAGLSLEGTIRWFILGLLLTAYLVIFIFGVSILKLNFFIKAHCRGDTNAKQVALTFDDGPDQEATLNLLKVLKRHEIKVVFFPIGTKIRAYPEIIKQVDQEGHIIGNHSFRHAWWTNFLISGALDREIKMVQEAMEAAISKVPAYFRPPMGLTNPHLKSVLKKNRLSVIGWDIRPFDIGISADKVIKKVLKKIRNGSIILIHDRGRAPADLARLTDELVTEIKARKFAFSDIEELTGNKAYQQAEEVNRTEPTVFLQSCFESDLDRKRRFRRFLASKLASTAYVKRAIKEQVTLDAFKTTPSLRFLFGLSLVLFSYVLGWPMVGLFSVLSAYFQAPVLLMVGPAFYGFSHLVWMFGMYLAGGDCIKYADIVFSWNLHKAVEKTLVEK